MEEEMASSFSSILPVVLGVGGVILVLMIVSMWKIFEKAGKPGWSVLIPIYSSVVLLDIVKKPWWWLLLMMIPYIGAIWGIWAINLLMKSFGKSSGYTVGVLFLPIIFLPMLAFSKDTRFLGSGDGNKGDSLDQVF